MSALPLPHALDEFEGKKLLSSYGVPVVQEALVKDGEAAVVEAQRLGFPVALKACGEAFAHKTELGLVHLNLPNAAAVLEAATQLRCAMRGKGELLVQRMVNGKREFLVGIARDSQFGPILSFGLGGIFAEALEDVSLRVCPVDHDEALTMLDEIRARVLLGPFRGMPAVDRDAIARALTGLSRLAVERPDIDAVDINPLVIDGSAPVAVDALVILR